MGISYSRYQALPARIKRLEIAVQKKQWAVVEKALPEFANGQKISKTSYQLFEQQLGTKKAVKSLASQLADSDFYQIQNQHSWFKTKYFLPQVRYISWQQINVPTNTKIYISDQHNLWQLPKSTAKQHQAYIPGRYQIDFSINNGAYGKVTQRRTVDIRQRHYQLTLTPDYFVQRSDFQQKRLAELLDYYQSLNQAINNQLDFSQVTGVSEKDRTLLVTSFNELKPYLKAYHQQFQKIVMNTDSLKVDGGQEPQVTFDAYIDIQQSAQLKSDVDQQKLEVNNGDRQNMVVTMQYSMALKYWLIQDVDFETYVQLPSDWQHTKTIRLKQPSRANWVVGQSNIV